MAATLAACACGPSGASAIPEYGYQVVHTYPHDRAAFTSVDPPGGWVGGLIDRETKARGNTCSPALSVRHDMTREAGPSGPTGRENGAQG